MSLESLPPELHCKITEYLPRRDRQQLQKCSRALDAAHRIAPFFFPYGHFARYYREDDDRKYFSIFFADLELIFRDWGDDTEFERKRVVDFVPITERTTRFEGENYFDVAKRCFRDLFLKKNVSFRVFSSNYAPEQTVFENADKMNIAEMIFQNFDLMPEEEEPERFDLWLEHLNPKELESFVVYSHGGRECIIGNHAVLSDLKRLVVLTNSDVSDDQLLRLTSATDVHFTEARITPNGVNRLIRNWISRKVERGAEFEYSPANMDPFILEVLVENIEDVIYRDDHAIIPIAADRSLHIWEKPFWVRIECLRADNQL